ncbi:Fic family protein [Dyella sp. C9]|uniref:Fic family protein n=1 Tax=Dyella sp. C9 TaxID=2202154 RepID=UPI000DEFBDFF|nr:Fic family protein [Dyella sp. C9]
MRHRAGRYMAQPAGYRAFYPAPLPPQPSLQLEGELQGLLSQADRALGRLDGSIQILPNPDLFVFMYVRKEAVLSSQIEGTQSSLQDLLAAEAHILAPDRPRDVDEVVNYVNAMNYGLARLEELPVSVRLIREIHERLLQGVRGMRLTPGELRRSQNWIGHAGCSLNEASFVPPPPHEVPVALGALETFLHADSELPQLVQVGLAHAQFETIHPFLDGNGRVGRLLITFLLCQREILGKPVLYLSHFFKQHRAEYYERLQAVRDSGDWEGWLAFFLRGVASVSREATETARRILALREDHRAKVTAGLGRAAGNGHKLLEHLYQRPIVSVADVQLLTTTTYTAANNLVSRLVALGILEEATGYRRNRLFRYQAYIELFGESGEATEEAPG